MKKLITEKNKEEEFKLMKRVVAKKSYQSRRALFKDDDLSVDECSEDTAAQLMDISQNEKYDELVKEKMN